MPVFCVEILDGPKMFQKFRVASEAVQKCTRNLCAKGLTETVESLLEAGLHKRTCTQENGFICYCGFMAGDVLKVYLGYYTSTNNSTLTV